MSEAAQKYYSWMKEVNSKIPFIPILPFNVTNAYDEADIELWIASHRCLRPMPDNTNTNDPLSQRVIRRIMVIWKSTFKNDSLFDCFREMLD